MKRVRAGQPELPEARAHVAALRAMVDETPPALLCFERDPAMCHRSLLTAATMAEAEVLDLFVSDLVK
nr:DUF488 domain-containing protein [Sphingomonas horti]